MNNYRNHKIVFFNCIIGLMACKRLKCLTYVIFNVLYAVLLAIIIYLAFHFVHHKLNYLRHIVIL